MNDAREIEADALLQALLTGDLQSDAADVVARFAEEPELAARWQELAATATEVDTALGSVLDSLDADIEEVARVDIRAAMAQARPARSALWWRVAAAVLVVGLLFALWPRETGGDPMLGVEVKLTPDDTPSDYARFAWRGIDPAVATWQVLVFDTRGNECDRSDDLPRDSTEWTPGVRRTRDWPAAIRWRLLGLDASRGEVVRRDAETSRQ